MHSDNLKNREVFSVAPGGIQQTKKGHNDVTFGARTLKVFLSKYNLAGTDETWHQQRS